MNRWLTLIFCVVYLTGMPGYQPPAFIPIPPIPAIVEDQSENSAPSGDEISPAQEQAMWEDITRNIEILRSKGALAIPDTSQNVTYTFSLRMSPGLPDSAGFRVSAFADHNPSTGSVVDYNGGTRTYDGHRGTDYALWPFSWNKMDAGEMLVIAAAPGIIVSSANVDSTDHNCLSSSSDPWNYVALLHADGRMTIYGHLRYNSLTKLGIGQSVAQGEYLGTAGSSGNSSGPHLHFEVRYGNFTNAEWMDPYAGPNSQPGSLWENQLAYFDSAINKLSTHSSPPATPDPCKPSIPNLQDSFNTPARIYFYAFYRDYQGALATQLKIYRPDGSIYNAWQYISNGASFNSVWNQGWVFDFNASDPAGTWRFEAVYNDQVYLTYFNLNAPQTITVTSQNDSLSVDKRLAHPIIWTDNFGGEVNIALYRSGIYSAAIANNQINDGEFLWLPDPALETGLGYSLRVSSVINPAVYDENDTPFSIVNTDVITSRNDFALTKINTPVTIDVLNNDASANQNTLTVTATGNPGHGAVTNLSSNLIYTPEPGFLGPDIFSYTVSSGTEHADAIVTIQVAAEVFVVSLPLIRR